MRKIQKISPNRVGSLNGIKTHVPLCQEVHFFRLTEDKFPTLLYELAY